jgi:hypothetical protein
MVLVVVAAAAAAAAGKSALVRRRELVLDPQWGLFFLLVHSCLFMLWAADAA